ncbi:FG-GAP repeat domain-containing protein [Herpetosiphon sp. NSE202]|uniref:FG-GAP repeat domain-containing protein n=1 Tax=Herpetosiphon sp. NSE202 TaxID=3351349 RepID=UPI00362D8BC4
MGKPYQRMITSSMFGLLAFGLVGGILVSQATSAAQLPAPAVDFASPVHYPTSFNAREVVNGDFNGDGLQDLASISWAGSTISVNLGNGDGTFDPANNYTTGLGQSWGIDTGDINNDNKLDLVVASRLSGYLTTYLGVGDGTFQYHSAVAADGNPMKIRLGDFNKDDNLDMAFSLEFTNSIAVRFGLGNGNFQASQFYTVGYGPLGITTADLDRDSNLDLIVSNASSTTISVLKGSNTGTFAAAVNYTVGTTPQESTVADFNGDTFPDVAVANWGSSDVSIFCGSATGALTLSSTIANVNAGHDIASADINGDGFIDIAMTNSLPTTYLATVGVLLGQGNLNFDAPATFATGTNPSSIVIGHFNNDSLPDLATANYHSHDLSILLNESIENKIFLPLVTDSRPTFPIAINPIAQALIPVTQQGQIYYTTTLRINNPLPATGRFYLSSRRDAVAAVRVDDRITVWANNQVLYENTLTTPQIVEVSRSELQTWLDQPLTITFRDVAGSVYGNSEVWLIWLP